MAAAARDNTVLIVEDDTEIREMLRDLLEEEGFAVVCAQNGLEALEALGGGARPKLILLDLMMPVMNGWEFLDAVRERKTFSEIPIAVVSAVADREKIGAARLIPKPIDVDVLLREVHHHCR